MDKIFEEAVRLAREEGKVSTMFLQRRLFIGYSRAKALIDEMQRQGIIGEYRGEGKPYLVITA